MKTPPVPASFTSRCAMLRAVYGYTQPASNGSNLMECLISTVEAEVPAYGFDNQILLPQDVRYTPNHLMSLTFFERVSAVTEDGIVLASADLSAQHFTVLVPHTTRFDTYVRNIKGGALGDEETGVPLRELHFAERKAKAA